MPLLFWQKPRDVVLYGKRGCHLCDDARQMLRELGRVYPLRIREVDITSDPVLFRRYDIVIPVVVVDGQRELCAPVRRQELRAALRR